MTTEREYLEGLRPEDQDACGAVYQRNPGLRCVKGPDHEGEHAVCIGAHDHGDGDLEYEWEYWTEGGSDDG